MAFSLGYSPWLLGLSLLIAGGLTYWSYRRTIPALSSGWKATLGALRFASLALICFLLVQPILRLINDTEEPPILAVLVDNSESMRVVQGAADTTAAAVRARVSSLLEPLRNDTPGSVRFFGFDRRLTDAPLDSLSFDGVRSDVGAALQSVPEALQGQNLRAVALVSDGQYNSGRDPARVADRFSVPIHTITVGDTSQQQDLLVQEVLTNDRAYVDTKVPVRVTLQATGLDASRTTLTLRQGDTLLDTAQVSLPTGAAQVSTDLSFRPEQAGLARLTVRATPVPGESLTANNERSVRLRVLDNKRQALLLGAAPSPSFGALRRVLARDANTTVTARVPRTNGSFYGGPLPDTLDRYDVLVCAGFPSAVVPSATVRRVADRVADGLPTVFVLDRQTDVAAWRDHFADALPATPNASALSLAEATVAPVDRERSHPILQIDGARIDRLRELPPLRVPSTTWTPTPDARVLAQARRPALSRVDPVLIIRRRAGHRTALLLGTDTWRWATLPADLQAADPLWPGLVSNLLRWTITAGNEEPVRVRPSSATFEGDAPVTFSGQVYDESQTPVSEATVELVVTDSTGTRYPHTMEPLGNGRYTLDIGALPEGTYRYEATARRDGTTLGRDRGDFSVGALRLEYQEPRADPVLMRRIAARAGGRAYGTADADALPAVLAADSSFAPRVSVESTEAELWRRSLFLMLILSLLAAEWTLRKRFGLS
jgi:hypothetical protein